MSPRKWPVDEIPEGGASVLLPAGTYRTKVGLTEAMTSTNKLMYVFVGRVTDAHPEYVGAPVYENFVIGSDNDRDAEDPDTWKRSIGARRMRQLFTAAGVSASEDVDAMVEAANDVDVMTVVQQEIVEKRGRGGAPVLDEHGKPVREPRNRIVSFYPAPDGASPPKAAANTQAAKPTPAPAPAAAKPKPTLVAKAEPTMQCAVCKEQVPRSAFVAHVATHGEDEE